VKVEGVGVIVAVAEVVKEAVIHISSRNRTEIEVVGVKRVV